MAPKDKARRTRGADVVTRDYTINLHKRLHGVCFKNWLQCSPSGSSSLLSHI